MSVGKSETKKVELDKEHTIELIMDAYDVNYQTATELLDKFLQTVEKAKSLSENKSES